MRKTFKKILVILLILLTLNNFLINCVYAADPGKQKDPEESKLANIIGSVVGLFTWPVRAVALAASTAINILTAGIAYIEGTTDPNDTTINTKTITPFDIFFNKVAILDVNFFDFDTIEEESLIYKIRSGIASWYYILRIIAASILLVVLIYVGIRMAISTVATDKAMYKKMLVDWVCSLAIIFLIHYVIIFVINISNALTNAVSLSVNSQMITDTYVYIKQLAYHIWDLESVAATVIFCMLVWQTFGLVISYFNRMLKLAFLVIISPLITLTYSMDKMGDGKAQALGNWLKEYVYTVLIQPVHCIIYMCFINMALSLLIEKQGNAVSRETIAVAIISILCVKFVKDAENLVRKIFRFGDDGSASLGAGLAVAGMALQGAKSIGRGTRSAINGTRNFAGNLRSNTRNLKVGAMALGAKIANSDGSGKSFSERKEEARTNMNNKEAEKMERKYGSATKYTAPKGKDLQKRALEIKKESLAKGQSMTTGQALQQARNEKTQDRIDNEINKRAEKIKNDYGGYMSDDEAKSIARLEIAKEGRNENSKPRKVISGAKGKINSFRAAVGQSDTLKSLGGLAKSSISAGLGLAVGSGIVGTKGDFLTGIMAGTAMYKGSQEFMNSSSKTLANNMNQNFKALGINSASEMSSKAGEIIALFSDEDKAAEQLSKIMDELEKSLEQAGVNGKLKTNIKNIIEGGIKADPSKTKDIIDYAMSNADLDPKKIDNPGVMNVRNAAQKLADYTNQSQIYQSIQTAGDIGLTADTIVGEAIGRFVPDKKTNYEQVAESTREVVETDDSNNAKIDPEKYQQKMESIEDEVSVRDEYELEELTRELEKEKENIISELKKNGTSKDNREKIEKDIDRANKDIISRATLTLDQSADKIKQEIVNNLEKEIAEIKKEIISNGSVNTSSEELLKKQLDRMEETKRALNIQLKSSNP